jgi:type VI secretion system protein ImpH
MEAVGTDERASAGALVERLLSRPQGFNLFQAISLLERAAPELAPVGRGEGQVESVRLSALVSLAFQPSDISSVRVALQTDEAYVLATPVMSLAGAQGPLPLPLTELVLSRIAARDHATADFLDIFNHRFLAFLYRSRQKHHVGLNWQSPQSSALATCLDAIGALALKSSDKTPRGLSPWLRHAGLLGGAPRSMSGLLVMLSDRLGVTARGGQFCGGWRQLEPRDVTRLCARAPQRVRSLGQGVVLGQQVWDQSAGITIELANLTLLRLRGLLKGGAEYGLMTWMIQNYLAQNIDVEVVLHVKPGEHQPCILSQQEPLRLGLTSWLVTRKQSSGSMAPVRFKIDDMARCVA